MLPGEALILILKRKRGLNTMNRVMILAAATAAFALAGCGPSRSTLLKEIRADDQRALESYASRMRTCNNDPSPWNTPQRCREAAEHSLDFHAQLMRDGFQALRDDRLIDALERRGW